MTKALLGSQIGLEWVVVETDAMVRQATSIIHAEGLSFVTSLDEAVERLGGRERVDAVHTSGTIQYVPHPEQLIDNLVAINASILLIARLPVHAGARCVGVQTSLLSHNGPGPMPAGLIDRQISYPITFINKGDLGRQLLSHYQIVGQFLSPSANYKVEARQAPGISLLLRHSAK
jgi:hypothetical protein